MSIRIDHKQRKAPKIARTECKECVFAQYKGRTQYGCDLNRIEKLEANGATIIPVFDHEKDFYVIEDRFCTAFRPDFWLDQLGDIDGDVAIYKEIAYQPDVIIYCNKKTTKDEIVASFISSFTDTEFRPETIHIILDETDVDGVVLSQELVDHQKDGIPFFVTRSYAAEGNKGLAIELTHGKLKANYFVIIKAGKKLDNDYYSRIDDILNHQLKRLVLEKNGVLTISRPAYQSYINLSDEESALDRILKDYPKGCTL